MSALLKGFVGSLSDALDFNQATLSGAIDIVVIEHDDGTRRSTPFHVRFGKLQLLRSKEKVVSIAINGVPTPFSMKMGGAGEAFFVEPCDEDVHPSLATSPMHSPTRSPSVSPERYSLDSTRAAVPAATTASTIPAVPLDGNDERSFRWTWSWGSFPVRKASALDNPTSDTVITSPTVASIAAAEADVAIADQPFTLSSNRTPRLPKPARSQSWMSSIFGIFSSTFPRNVVDAERDVVDVGLSITSDGVVKVKINILDERAASPNVEGPPSRHSSRSSSVTALSAEESAIDYALTPGSVEMSTCGHLLHSDSPHENAEAFTNNIVTFDRLGQDPNIVFQENLVVRHQNILYPGVVALPLIMSFLAFDRPLDASALERLAAAEGGLHTDISIAVSPPKIPENVGTISPDEADAGSGATVPQSSRNFLYRWFQGSDAAPPAHLSNEISEDDQIDPLSQTAGISTTASDIPDPKPSASMEPPDVAYVHMAYRKTLRPCSKTLCELPLRPGPNIISFTVVSSLQGIQTIEAYLYLWKENARLVISDIDGTITRSDLLGNIMPLMGKDWSHSGVATLFSNIAANGYRIIYLTSRAIGQANITRAFLHSVRQDQLSLPQGPVIMSPDSLIHSFKREVIYRRPQEFKIPALRDVVSSFPTNRSPFVAGFGNRSTDIESYLAVGVPSSNIFIIDPNGNIHLNNSLHRTSYMLLNENVEHMFPPFDQKSKGIPPASYNEFQFWRNPIKLLYDADEQSNDDDEELQAFVNADEDEDEKDNESVISTIQS